METSVLPPEIVERPWGTVPTVEEIRRQVAYSTSMVETVQRLGYGKGSRWRWKFVQDVIRREGMSTEHWGKQRKRRVAKSFEEYFVIDPPGAAPRWGQMLRKWMLRAGIPDVCVECGLGPEWRGKKLTLQVDHINGNRLDHRLENLRILCPNCHTQTSTYARGLRGTHRA